MENFRLKKPDILFKDMRKTYFRFFSVLIPLINLAKSKDKAEEVEILEQRLAEITQEAENLRENILLDLNKIIIEKMRRKGFKTVSPVNVVKDPLIKEGFPSQYSNLYFTDKNDIEWDFCIAQDLSGKTKFNCTNYTGEGFAALVEIPSLWDLVTGTEKIDEFIEKICLQQLRLNLQLEEKTENVDQKIKQLENYLLGRIKATGFICREEVKSEDRIVKNKNSKGKVEKFHLNLDFELDSKKLKFEYPENISPVSLTISVNLVDETFKLAYFWGNERFPIFFYDETFFNFEDTKVGLERMLDVAKKRFFPQDQNSSTKLEKPDNPSSQFYW